jgi:hypothetical protein
MATVPLPTSTSLSRTVRWAVSTTLRYGLSGAPTYARLPPLPRAMVTCWAPCPVGIVVTVRPEPSRTTETLPRLTTKASWRRRETAIWYGLVRTGIRLTTGA